MYTIRVTREFSVWLANLKDGITRIRLGRSLEKAEKGDLGDVQPVGEDVCEMREYFGPSWRMYYTQRGATVIVMLGGGDKSTQKTDIAKTIRLAKTLEN